jgi:hypothetical protein
VAPAPAHSVGSWEELAQQTEGTADRTTTRPSHHLSGADEGGRSNGAELITPTPSAHPMAERPRLHQPHFAGYDRAQESRRR